MAIDWQNPQPSDIFDADWHADRDKDERRGLTSLKATKDFHDLTKFLVENNRNILAIKHERAVFEFMVTWGESQRVLATDDLMVQMISAWARSERYFRAENNLRRIKDEGFDRLQKVYVILRSLQDFYGEFSQNDQIVAFADLASKLQRFCDGMDNYIRDHNEEYKFWRARAQEMYRDIKAQCRNRGA